MIRSFYGLLQNPFDLRDFELLPGQQEIYDTLTVHCQQGGLCLVLGVPGTGKSVIKQALQRPPSPPEKSKQGEDMVQDPHCGTYVPRSDAVSATVKGERYYFCSEKCRTQFQTKR